MIRPKILNVDDDEAGRFAVTQILRSAGFQVLEATNGREALEMSMELPDIMLLDVGLPDMHGFEVCKRVKSNPKTNGITVIHLSASLVAPADRVEGLEGGADGYLTEPVNQHELVATLRAFLRLRSIEASQRFLAHVSGVLSEGFEADAMLRKIAALAVPFVVDVCLVDKIDEHGNVQPMSLCLQTPSGKVELDRDALAGLPVAPELRQGVARVVARGVAELQREPDDAWLLATLGVAREQIVKTPVHAYLCVPLVARKKTLGAITFLSCSRERELSTSDVTLATELAQRSALLVDNARLYEESRKAVRMRENLLAVVSHDLKNPLSNISMNAILMLKQWPADERIWRLRGYIESIQRAAGSMNHLIHDLLDLAGLDAGALSMKLHRCAPARLVSEILEMLEPLALEKHIHLTGDVLADLPVVVCDKERILQVLSNLVGNSLKFTPERGTVTVSAAPYDKDPNVVCFSVTDNGPGIADKQLPYIFDRFWQASETARFGSGLGLSIAKGIVEAHGGRIWVERTSSSGSVFAFTLPMSDGHATPVGPVAVASTPQS